MSNVPGIRSDFFVICLSVDRLCIERQEQTKSSVAAKKLGGCLRGRRGSVLYPRNECHLSFIWLTSTLPAAKTSSCTTSTSPSTLGSTSPFLVPMVAASPPLSRPSPASVIQSSGQRRRSASSNKSVGTLPSSKNVSVSS